MYIPKNMAMESSAQLIEFIAEFPFAVVVSNGSSSFEATHIPLIVETGSNGQMYLLGHLAKSNSQLERLANVLAIFSGPHAYISPTWYTNKPAVPTWNYAAVHATGSVELMNSEQTLLVVEKLTRFFEPSLVENKDIIPEAYAKRLANAIVGFRIKVEKLEGKLKFGQHRSKDDQAGVVEGLKRSEHSDSQSLLSYMKRIGCGLGD